MIPQLVCINRTRNFNSDIILYDLMTADGRVETMKPKDVKAGLMGNVFTVSNLKLAKNEKILYCNNYINPNFCYIDSFDLYTRYRNLRDSKSKILCFRSGEDGKKKLAKYKLMNIPIVSSNIYKDFVFIETNKTIEFISEKQIRFRNSNLRENAGLKAEGHFKGMVFRGIDLSQVDTSEMTNMSFMFEECRTEQLNLGDFNTSNVMYMSYMFSGFGSPDIQLDLHSFDTSKVIDMSCMFSWCRSTKDLNLSHFNTQNVELMYGMFGQSKFNSIDIRNFVYKSNVNIRDMFRYYSGNIIR